MFDNNRFPLVSFSLAGSLLANLPVLLAFVSLGERKREGVGGRREGVMVEDIYIYIYIKGK